MTAGHHMYNCVNKLGKTVSQSSFPTLCANDQIGTCIIDGLHCHLFSRMFTCMCITYS